MRALGDIDLAGKVALVRADLNVPMEDGEVTDGTRVSATLPTLRAVMDRAEATVVLSHLGRPAEGAVDQSKSLAPVARKLGGMLGMDVPLVSLEDAKRPGAGELVLLENTRFNSGEKACDPGLAARYASLGDVFVLDAFASAHRAEASTVGLAKAASESCAGLLVEREVSALAKAMDEPARPLVAIVGGAKASTKIAVLSSLAGLADRVVVGGGIANTFLLATGLPIGKSLAEAPMAGDCAAMLEAHPGKFVLPEDVVTAKDVSATSGETKGAGAVAGDDLILDTGPSSIAQVVSEVEEAGTVIWNGTLGMFEKEPFSAGTRALAEAMGRTDAFTLAGGGETVAAANRYGVAERISWLSTGGGAFLEFVEGKELPALAALG